MAVLFKALTIIVDGGLKTRSVRDDKSDLQMKLEPALVSKVDVEL